MENKNIFGESLIVCSTNPLTGYFRDGCCNTDDTDLGLHTVCIVATEKFLTFSKLAGNDLSTPLPEYSFPGVKPGDKWCLCALRFKEAYEGNAAPKVILEATNEKTLDVVSMDILIENAFYTDKV
ncbi:MAG: DUF2237 domain-containing protein [Flavobacteriales bacterium]|nr:DUF2237 domain-containing protein [Flavobacteriales bacterium]NQX96608.1 DUF2237 domain-containing protein [Flavobacteriales bacterium]